MAEAIFPHLIEYPEAEQLTLSDVANTLIAHEKLVRIAGQILENSVDGLTVERIVIRLDAVAIGSLKEAFFVALIATYQEDLQKGVPELIEALTGIDVPDKYNSVITLLILVIMIYGAQYIVQRLAKKSGAEKQTTAPLISGNYNTYISLTADGAHPISTGHPAQP
jgi:hypothetical protein